ncbi:Flocculation suppression protein [Basidiobolus ranarum]|uniref:Flocculation suppression protein n=1 Tax=Basidiobolus ranarum TaxID=34480 RepID=A0ABR2WE51_9FUNG
MLSESKYFDVIAWEPSGNRFVIKDPVKFASEVLPQFYETDKLASFTRQLNIHGFYQVPDPRTKTSNHSLMAIHLHRYFRRDQPNEYYLVQRLKNPYSRAMVAFPIPELEASTITKPPEPSLSLAISLYPPICAQPISQDEQELACTKKLANQCLNCSILRQEVKMMSKQIEYYISIVNKLVSLHTLVYDRLLSLQTPIASNS